VGAARSLARGSLALALVALAAGAGAQQLEAVGACRDSVPNGAYELYQADGRLRAVGAFAQGRRTGTFIFWTGDGARIGVIPYSDDARSGTIALWYTTRGSGRELRPKSEAPYVDSRPHGVKRSWYRSGRPELEARYERGGLREVQAWAETGSPLADAEARALAARELSGDEALYAALDALVQEHRPRCD
jgi:antitoxin component YwqK of YwqJK toxin-antitoxin module